MANPGNDKDVGRAGEDPNGRGAEFWGSGARGASDGVRDGGDNPGGGPGDTPGGDNGGGPIEDSDLDSLFVVTTADDVVNKNDGLISLREAIAYAADNDGVETITFDDSLLVGEDLDQKLVIDLDSPITIDTDVVIDGRVQGDPLVVRAEIIANGDSGADFHFTIAADADVTLKSLTLSEGSAAGDAGSDGKDGAPSAAGTAGTDGESVATSIYNAGDLTLDGVTFSTMTGTGGDGGAGGDGGDGGDALFIAGTGTVTGDTLIFVDAISAGDGGDGGLGGDGGDGGDGGSCSQFGGSEGTGGDGGIGGDGGDSFGTGAFGLGGDGGDGGDAGSGFFNRADGTDGSDGVDGFHIDYSLI